MVAQLKKYQVIDLESRVLSANRSELISILYEHILLNANKAKFFIGQKTYDQKSNHLNKMNAIVLSLIDSLDKSKYPELSNNLESLYAYCLYLSFKATSQNKVEYIDEIIEIIKTIKEGWEEAIPLMIKS